MGNRTNTEQPLILAMRLVKGEDVLIVGAAIYLSAVLALGGNLPAWDTELIFVMLFGMLGVAGVNSFNQIYDDKIDAINKPLRPIPSNKMGKKSVLYISSGLLITGGCIAAYLAVTLSPLYFLIGCMGLLTALIYTLPKPRLKKYPLISTAIMGFGYGPFLFLLGWTVYREPLDAPLWILIFLYFHEVFILITKDYRDIEGDRKYNIRTLPVVLGRERAAFYNYMLYITPFVFVTVGYYSGLIDYYPLWLLTAGLVIALPMFWLCSKNNIKHNVAGYYIYIIAFILVRIILAYTI